MKIVNLPKEIILEGFLEENGFKIINEEFRESAVIYKIARNGKELLCTEPKK